MSEVQGNIETFPCSECGIHFGIDVAVTAQWKKSHKKFQCPNGHELSWNDKTELEKEVEKLRAEVAQLKEKLQVAETEATAQHARADELAAKLEIWEPSDRQVE